jgi:argininosuccinate lyase
VVATVRFNERRLREQLDQGFSQATDLAEYVMTTCGLDYRTAYRLVGTAVRRAAATGRRGADIDPALLDEIAGELLGHPLGLDTDALAAAMEWEAIVATRTAVGGAAREPVEAMVAETGERARRLLTIADQRAAAYADAEAGLRERAREAAGRDG